MSGTRLRHAVLSGTGTVGIAARLSRSMKRALTVATALVHRPRLLFLDEPTVGLDVVSAHGLRALIGRLRDEGVTGFLTTHYLEETERLADRVALIVRGRMVATDTVQGLKARVGHGVGAPGRPGWRGRRVAAFPR